MACRAVNFVTLDDPTATNPKHAKPPSVSSGGKSVACRAVTTPATLLLFMHEDQRKLFVRFVRNTSVMKLFSRRKPLFRRPKTLVAIVTRDIHATRKSAHLTSLLVIGNKKLFRFFRVLLKIALVPPLKFTLPH